MGRRRIGVGFATAVLLGTLAAPAAVASPHVDVIVQFMDGTGDSRGTADAVARQHRASLTFVYEHALQGFAGSMPANRVEGLRRDPRVAHVEFDQAVSIAAQQVPTGIQRIFATSNDSIGIDGTDDVRVDVDVAVLDTGIDASHPDLHVVQSVDCMNHTGGPPFSRTYYCTSGGTDGHGHGTHVAGTIAALDNAIGVVGVAPGARLHAVRVLDDRGSGSNATVIAGIDWVTAQGTIEVANLSLGGSPSSAVDTALTNLANSGVAIALAAGNSSADVTTAGPAGHPLSLTVSALADYDGLPGGLSGTTCRDSGADDSFATFSNYGDTEGNDVDVIAPGVCILSTVPGGYGTASGTSMAAPHVAGALALLASNAPNGSGKGLSGAQGHYTTIRTSGNPNWDNTNDGDTTKEPLLDVGNAAVFAPGFTDGSGGGTEPPPTENQAPTASFTFNCDDLACDFDGSDSSDPDGSIASYAWTFGDGGTATGVTPSHTYGADDTYTATLTVTDNEGATGQASQQVTVSASTEPGGIALSASAYKVRGVQHADLSWSGATSTSVDIFRGSTRLATVGNTGSYTDNIGNRGGGSYTYQVCEAGTSTCSNTVTVTF